MAVKVVSGSFLPSASAAALNESDRAFRQEILLHMKLTHPRIVQMVGIRLSLSVSRRVSHSSLIFLVSGMGRRGQHLLLLTEYCAQRSLHDVMRSTDPAVQRHIQDWGLRRKLAIEVCSTLCPLFHPFFDTFSPSLCFSGLRGYGVSAPPKSGAS